MVSEWNLEGYNAIFVGLAGMGAGEAKGVSACAAGFHRHGSYRAASAAVLPQVDLLPTYTSGRCPTSLPPLPTLSATLIQHC